MSLNNYYQSELTALRQLGKRFAERNPALAPFLGQSGRDPDVERLLEGFAFLTGRLRQKLDDELPELTHSLMHLLWPNYMRPLPAFGMLQYSPLAACGPAQQVLRDTQVKSVAVEGVRCKFRTVFDTDVLPLALKSLGYALNGEGAILKLQLTLPGPGHMGQVSLKSLRLHLAGERYISQQLYLSLLRHLGDVQVQLLNEAGQPLLDSTGEPVQSTLSAQQLKPVGFAEEEALIPYPLNTFRGYRYLQEYFAFPEKFLFVDLNGLEVLASYPEELLKQARGLEIRFNLHGTGTQQIQPTLENVLLYCTPIVNLFSHHASPVRVDGKHDRYHVKPDAIEPEHYGVFSVDRVEGWRVNGSTGEEYVPFESFEHDTSFDVPHARPHYSVRQEPSVVDGQLYTYLSFGVHDGLQSETVSIELTCTNQDLPQQLKEGDIVPTEKSSPTQMQYRNIGAMTRSYAPPLHRDFLWKLISNMSLNYLSLANVAALKVILETYDLPRYYDKHAEKVSRTLLAGLTGISHQPTDRLYRGLPVRGVRTTLTIDPQGYRGEGDLYLFASVLNEFFALYTSLNSFHQLHVRSTQGEHYEWTPRMGQQPLL